MSEVLLGSADVAIIGAGLVGCSTAYYLAKGGVDVAVIERGNVNREASGANAGSLHLQIYIHPHFPEDWIDRIRPTIELIREAQKSWATMEERLGTDCGIRLGGGLWVAETPDEMKLIERKVAAENALGVMSEIYDRAGILRLAPYLGEHVIGGSFLVGEGFANPLLVTPAHLNAARKHGARFFADAAVSAITRNGNRFVIETTRGRFSAGQVIAAAGAWTASIGRMVGLNLPVTGSIGQVSVTEGRPNIMLDHMLQHVGKGLTLKQSRQGTFIIGGGWPGLYDRNATGNRRASTRSSGTPGSPPARSRKSPRHSSCVPGAAWALVRSTGCRSSANRASFVASMSHTCRWASPWDRSSGRSSARNS